MKFPSNVIMWTLTFALPYTTTLAFPLQSTESLTRRHKDHSLRTKSSSSSSSFSSSFPGFFTSTISSSSSSSSASSSLSRITTMSSFFSRRVENIVLELSAAPVIRTKREQAGQATPSLEPVISGVQKKAGADVADDSDSSATVTSRTPSNSQRRRRRKNRGSKKRPASKKRRRRRKCPKKDKKQRRRKHRKCSRSRKSRRNGKKKRKDKQKKQKNGKRGNKKRRQVTGGDNSESFATTEKPEVVNNQKVVKPEEASHPRSFRRSNVKFSFNEASSLQTQQKHIQEKESEQKPARPRKEIMASYNASQPLLANRLKNIHHHRNSNENVPSNFAQKHPETSPSKHERFKRSTTILLQRFSSLKKGGNFPDNVGKNVLNSSSNERTNMLKILSSGLLRCQ